MMETRDVGEIGEKVLLGIQTLLSEKVMDGLDEKTGKMLSRLMCEAFVRKGLSDCLEPVKGYVEASYNREIGGWTLIHQLDSKFVPSLTLAVLRLHGEIRAAEWQIMTLKTMPILTYLWRRFRRKLF